MLMRCGSCHLALEAKQLAGRKGGKLANRHLDQAVRAGCRRFTRKHCNERCAVRVVAGILDLAIGVQFEDFGQVPPTVEAGKAPQVAGRCVGRGIHGRQAFRLSGTQLGV